MSQPNGEQGTTTPSTGGQDSNAAPSSTGSAAQPNTPSSTAQNNQTFTQDDVNRIVQERVSREQAKYGDYEALKARAAQWDTFVNESKTDQEKALDQARKDAENAAYTKARNEFGGQLVEANLRAAAVGRMSDGALQALLAGVDKSIFLTDTGSVDTTKVTQFIDGIAPAKSPSGVPGGFGQGPREGTPKAGIDAGRAAWESRHPKDSTSVPPLFT